MRLKRLGIVLPLLLLLVAGQAVGNARVQEYTPPYEVTDKDLNPLYGRYEIYEADKYRGSVGTTAAEAQAWVGQELIVTATLFQVSLGSTDRESDATARGFIPSNRDIMCRSVRSVEQPLLWVSRGRP